VTGIAVIDRATDLRALLGEQERRVALAITVIMTHATVVACSDPQNQA
jgi:hypothetical protein